MGPSPRDWALLAVSGGFTAAGLWLLARGASPGLALASSAFFALCTAVGVAGVREKRRAATFAGVAGEVEASGEQIPESRARWAGTGVALGAVGGILAGVDGIPWPVTLVGVALGATGLAILVGLATGRLGHRWLRFAPEGLRVGERRGSVLLPWDDLAGCQVGAIGSSPVVSLLVRDPARAVATAAPPSYAAAAAALLPGGVLTLLPRWYGLDAGLLARSVSTYVLHPERRAALGRPRLRG